MKTTEWEYILISDLQRVRMAYRIIGETFPGGSNWQREARTEVSKLLDKWEQNLVSALGIGDEDDG